MDESPDSSTPLAGAAKRFVHRLLAIGENRFQLLAVEVREERNRFLDMVFVAIATGTLALLTGIAWSAALVMFFWPDHLAAALLILGAVYCIAAVFLCRWLLNLRRNPQTFSATLEQIQKDRACLKRN